MYNRSHYVSDFIVKLNPGESKNNYKLQQDLLVTVLKRAASLDDYEEWRVAAAEVKLAWAVIERSVLDIGTRCQNVPSLVGGGLDSHLDAVGIDPKFFRLALRRSRLLRASHYQQIKDAINETEMLL